MRPAAARTTQFHDTSTMLSGQLGSFVAACRYECLPSETVEALKIRILDTIGAGIAGAHLGNHLALLPLLHGGNVPVWGTAKRVSARDAVLVNAFLVHSTYLEDGSRYTGGHPSSAVIPGALALVEAHPRSGRDVIAAVASGYEIFLRLGRVLYPAIVKKGFQSTAVLGSLASAGATANVLRLNAEQCAAALAIACTLGVGLKAALKCPGSQPLQVGRAGEGGLVATLFAASGAEGALAIIEEGFLPAFGDAPVTNELAGLGSTFSVDETYLKIHGGCRGNHAPVDAIQCIQNEHPFPASEVEQVWIDVDSVTYAADVAVPETGKEAQFSIRFSVACALLAGDASIFRFTDDQVLAPAMRAMMSRIVVRPDPELDRDYPRKRGARAEVLLANSLRRVACVDNARGEPELPLTRMDIERKFVSLVSPHLGPDTQRVLDLVMNLESMRDVRSLTSRLASERETASRSALLSEGMR